MFTQVLFAPDREIKHREIGLFIEGALVFLATIVITSGMIATWSHFGPRIPVLPVNAVAIAYLNMRRTGRWAPLLLAYALGSFIANFVGEPNVLRAGALAASDVTQVALICWLLQLAGGPVDLTRPRDLIRYTFICCTAPWPLTVLTSLGLDLAHRGGWAAYFRCLSADVLGLLIIGPALMLILADWKSRSRLVAIPVFALLVCVLIAVFGQRALPVLFLIPPVLMLVAFELSFACVGIALLLTAFVATVAVLNGYGPTALVSGSPERGLFVLQLFLATNTLSTLPIAAVLSSRRRLSETEQAAAADARAARAIADEKTSQAQLAEQVSGLGYWRFDRATEAVTWSDGIFLIAGRDRAAGPPSLQEALSLYTMTSRSQLAQVFNAALEQGLDYELELEAERPSGEIRRVLAKGICVRDADGRTIGLFGTLLDITPLRAAQDAAEQSERRYRYIAENASDMIVQFDLQSRTSYVSSSCERVLGLPAEALLHRELQNIIHPEDLERFQSSLIQAQVADMEPSALSARFKHADGTWIWLEGQPNPVYGLDGRPTGFVDVLRDVTKHRKFTLELQAAREQAEAASRAKANFLSSMSHEIRTPMNGVVGYADLLSDSSLNVQQTVWVKRIQDAGRTLLQLLNSILEFSRLEAGGVDLHLVALDPRDLIESCVELLRPAADGRSIRLESSIHPTLVGWIEGDELRLKQVLLNLLGNALKFTQAGSVTLAARPTLNPAGDLVGMILEVTDTGIGIPADKLSSVMQDFSQSSAAVAKEYGGSGLGLSIVARLVDLMGGEIQLISQLGVGTRATITLPTRIMSRPLSPETAILTSSQSILPTSILVVDDIEVNSDLIRLLLERSGELINVETCNSGEAAIKCVQQRKFDLVFMDLQMPVIDGYEATRMLRLLGIDVPIVALTANVLPEVVKAAKAAGMQAHLAKPVKVKELLAAIATWAKVPETQSAPATARDHDPDLGALHEKFLARLRKRESTLKTIVEEWASLRPDQLDCARETAHEISGSAGMFGHPALSQAASNVELAFHQNDLKSAKTYLYVLVKAISEVQRGVYVNS